MLEAVRVVKSEMVVLYIIALWFYSLEAKVLSYALHTVARGVCSIESSSCSMQGPDPHVLLDTTILLAIPVLHAIV